MCRFLREGVGYVGNRYPPSFVCQRHESSTALWSSLVQAVEKVIDAHAKPMIDNKWVEARKRSLCIHVFTIYICIHSPELTWKVNNDRCSSTNRQCSSTNRCFRDFFRECTALTMAVRRRQLEPHTYHEYILQHNTVKSVYIV